MNARQFIFALTIGLVALFSAALRLQGPHEGIGDIDDVTATPTQAPRVQLAHPARAPHPRPSVTKPANRLAVRFHEVLDKTWEKLPLVENLKNATEEEIHFAPPGLIAIADDLARVAKIMRENPTLVPSGVEFYRSCALREAAYDSVRGFCLRQLKKWAPTAVRQEDFPADVRRIADSSPAS